MYYIIFCLVAAGGYFLLAAICRLPPRKAAQNLVNAQVSKKGLLKNIENTVLYPLITPVSRLIRMSEFTELTLEKDMVRAGIRASTKEYYARAVIISALSLILIPVLWILGVPVLIPLSVVLTGVLFRRATTKHRRILKKKREQVELALPSFIRTILYSLDKPQTAQQSMPYLEIYRDGICHATDKPYTKTLEFEDINCQLAQEESQISILEHYNDFFNYFGSAIHVQLSFINQFIDLGEYQKQIYIPDQDDKFNYYRNEFSDTLKGQLSKGNNGLKKRKFVTFGVEANSLKDAKQRLERIETDIVNNLRIMGVKSHSLNGSERLELLRSMLNPNSKGTLRYKWKDSIRSGLSTKDFIAPTSFDFRDGKSFRMGDPVGTVRFMQIEASEMYDTLLKDILSIDTAVTVTMHIQPVDQAEALKMVRCTLTNIKMSKIEGQKKTVRSGYDMDDALSSRLLEADNGVKHLLEDLQLRDQRVFLVTFLVMNTAKKQSQCVAKSYICVRI